MEKIKEFKKVFLQKIIPCIISCVLAVGLACGSYAWYSSSVKFEFNKNFSGTTDVAYFAGGDGSINNPYIINNRYHIYNLAWLQYLGYFNLGSPVNNGRAQNYFKITANINMQGLAIPPIGTEKYKFIGNIKGGGYAVSNLVVSNDINSLTVRPSTISSVDDCSIVGFFGVLGANANELTQMQTDGKTAIIDGNAVPVEVNNTADAPTATAGQAANLIYKKAILAQDFYLDKINVVSTTPKTLIGIAAGYVAGNLQNVGVYRSAVSVEGTATGLATALTDGGSAYGTTVSRYSIVGDYDEKNVTWESLPSGGSGDSNAWGGSIDIRTLNRRLSYMFANGTILTSDLKISTSQYYNTKLGLSSFKDEYLWNAAADDYISIIDGTILPININKEAMGVDSFDKDKIKEVVAQTVSKKEFHSNQEYIDKKNSGETLSNANGKYNTGYFVGAGADRYNPKLRAGIRLLASSSYGGGIYQSFKGSYSGDSLTYNDDTAKTFALLTLKGSGSDWTVYRIVDDTNKENYNADETYDGILNKRYDSTLLNFVEYKNVRGNFDITMNNSQTFHGFHFYQYIPDGTTNRANLSSYITQKDVNILGAEMSSYELIKGGLNFTVKERGYITAIIGTGYAQSAAHSLFDLYEVTRTNSKIDSIKQIEKIYTKYNNDGTLAGVSYNSQPDGYSLNMDIKSLSSSSNRLNEMAAFYFEIPVEPGDYVIGTASGSSSNNGYLMYLDIGANGGDGDGTTPVHSIKTVNFVNEAPSGTDPLGFDEYDVVVFFLDEPKGGAVKVVIYFKRKTENVDDGETKKATEVYYYPVPGLEAMGKITPTPPAYGENNQEAQNWN